MTPDHETPLLPVQGTGPRAAARIHYTDPRITALSRAAHEASPDSPQSWTDLDWHQRNVWRTAARDWLRAAVTVGLLPAVVPSTGEALAAVPLDVDPTSGQPRAGSRGRAAVFREAAHAVRPESLGWGGPDHYDAWSEAEKTLLALAAEEEASVGDLFTADQLHAAVIRVETWAGQLDDAARSRSGRSDATDPTADILRLLLDGARHGEYLQ